MTLNGKFHRMAPKAAAPSANVLERERSALEIWRALVNLTRHGTPLSYSQGERLLIRREPEMFERFQRAHAYEQAHGGVS